jgi:CheY-like chemotaxis protein
MHGGSVVARSEGKGRGSEFEVCLPLALVDGVGADRPDESESPGQLPTESAPRLRVLIVDDNQDAAELLADALGIMGYATRIAHDGPAALRIADEFRPHVGLLDIGLPVMDGYELARRLRDEPALRAMHLVAVTGYGQASDRARAEESGFDAHLVKPVDIDRMLEMLQSLRRDG